MTASLMVAKNTLLEAIRRKDIYVLGVICFLLILGSGFISFWDVSGLSRFLTDVYMTVIGIASSIIAVTTTARQLPGEIEGRTLYPLLAKPISRFSYLVGKFLGCWTISVFSMLIFTVAFLVALLFVKGSVGGLILLEALYTRALMLGVVVSLTLLVSTFLTHSANVTVMLLFCFGARLAGNAIVLTVDQAPHAAALVMKGIYWFIPHLELFDLSKKVVHDWPPVPVWVLLALTAYSMIYVVVALVVSHAIFSRKPL